MKRTLLFLCTVGLVVAAAAWSGQKQAVPELDFKLEERNPVTHLRLNNEPNDFQFAIVSDRTGGHRAKIFSRAVEQLNLLQPEFVISVGDLIEGYTDNSERLTREWREFQEYVSRLQMPFFYVPGNHDIANLVQDQLWKEKFGRRYYDFLYRNVLFLILNSEDPPGKDEGSISEEQLAFVKRSVESSRGVRWNGTVSRPEPPSMPAKVFVPDLVIAFTCTPADRPWVASNRFATNSNSAMASRL